MQKKRKKNVYRENINFCNIFKWRVEKLEDYRVLARLFRIVEMDYFNLNTFFSCLKLIIQNESMQVAQYTTPP